MVDIKKELYHAKLLQELKTKQEITKELILNRYELDDNRAINIITSLIQKYQRESKEVEALIELCIKSVINN